MNSSLWKDNIREIKKTLPRFLSIFAIITLGVAFFVGIRAAGPSMVKTAQSIYEESNIPDGQIQSTAGLNQQDLDILSDIEGVKWLPMQSVNSVLRPGEENVKIYTYNGDESTDFFKINEGRMVEASDEIVLDSKYLEILNKQMDEPIEIGDRISLDDPKMQGVNLKESDYTVVGFARSSLFIERITRSGSETAFVIVSDQAISGDIYTEAYYWVEAAQDKKEYTEEHNQVAQAAISRIEQAFEGRPEDRLAELETEIKEAIDEGQVEIDDGYQALEDVKRELNNAKKDLEDSRLEISQGQIELMQAIDELESGQEEFEKGVQTYHQGRMELADARAQIDFNEASYQEGLALYEEGLRAFTEGIADAEGQLNDAQAQLSQSAAEAQAGYATLVAGQEALDAGYSQLNAGRQALLEQISQATNQQIPPEELLVAMESQLDQLNAFIALLNQSNLENNPELVAWLNSLIIERDTLASNVTIINNLVSQLSQDVDTRVTISDLELTQKQVALLSSLLGTEMNSDIEISELIEQLNTELTRLESELEELNSQGKPQEVESLKEKINILEQRITDNQNRLKEIEAELTQLENAESLQSQLDSLNTQLQMNNNNTNQLNQVNGQLVEQLSNESLTEANHLALQEELATNEARLAELNNESSSIQANIDKITNQLIQRQTLEQERTDLNQQLEQNQRELEQLNNELENLTNEGEAPTVPGDLDLEAIRSQMQKLVNAIEMLQASQAELDSQSASLEAGWQEYYAGLAQLEQAQAAINEGWTELNAQRTSGQSQLDASYASLVAGRQQLDKAQAQILEGLKDLEAGRQTLNETYQSLQIGQDEMAEGRQKAIKGRWQLMQGEYLYLWNKLQFDEEYDEAIQELKDGEADLVDAEKSLADLSLPKYLVNDQTDFPAFQTLKNNADQLGIISNIFPVFFLAIALLVTFTTIKRMASEQRNYMGTMKQLGYRTPTIIVKFVFYAGIAGLLGAIVGIVLAYWIFPGVIINAYNMLYYFDNPQIAILWDWNLIAVMIALITVLTPAILTPLNMLRTQPANLLLPEPPKSGRKLFLERFPMIWNRFSFNAKMTTRNLLRYKGRNAMTLLGVAGCTMLIVTGFGISNTISSIVDVQFGQLQTSDGMVYLNTDVNEDEVESLHSELSSMSEIEAMMPVFQENYEFELEEGQTQTVTVMVPMGDLEDFSSFVTLRQRDQESQLENIQAGGPFVTERMGELLGLDDGHTFVIENEDFQSFDIGDYTIVENYAAHYIYLTESTYQEKFNQSPTTNSFLIDYQDDANRKTIEEDIISSDTVLTTVDFQVIEDNFSDQMGSLDLITLVLIVSAAALAFVVLYNLTNINVAERIRELSTIKVLGFYDNEVSMYIFNEVLILTFIGGIIGLAFGTVMNQFLLKTMQMNDILFHPTIHLSSYLLALAISFAFSSIVMLVMYFKLKKIDMVEALKGVE
ncbi:FtsX-like permease family protein [Aerococcaceae bacterium WGS1372]